MIFAGCSNSPQKSTSSPDTNRASSNSDHDDAINPPSKESPANDSGDISSENGAIKQVDKQDKEIRTQYSSEQIEYARIWLHLGPNQEIDELNVLHIPAGTINPNDDTSSHYPENVIQLAGSRLVEGSVTYSGNGDGTINVYNVPLRWDGTINVYNIPLRWDGNYPAGEEFYTDIIKNTKLVTVQQGDNEKIIKLIQLLNVQS
ncbi:hypothetical protein CHI06_20200 [Bacillus sp. 7884-1]|nr:hypothetical protein CHI06_20200 [Bacillus sp. 7884-1]